MSDLLHDLHAAEAKLIQAAAAIKDNARALGYEEGYAAGYAMGAERTSAPEGTVAKDDMLALLDRIQLFRQSIATYDTRYVALGAIIADFAEKLGAGGP